MGFIGSEVAASLRQLGVEVAVVAPGSAPLGRPMKGRETMTRTPIPDRFGREAAPVEAGGEALDSRAGLLRKLGLGAGALAGGGVLLGSPATAFAGHGDPQDADILNYALTLEYLEATFYTQALGDPGTRAFPRARRSLTAGPSAGRSSSRASVDASEQRLQLPEGDSRPRGGTSTFCARASQQPERRR